MNLLKALATVSSMTLLSRILGFVRDLLIARLFGAGMAADAFFVAFRIPNLLRRLFAEGAFSQAFVPILSEYKNTQSSEATRELIDQVATLLNERQAKQSRQTKGSTRPTNPAPVSAHRALAAQRKELNSLVAAYAKKTGAPHANVHMELRRACGGPELAQASSEQVTERIDRIRRWFVGRR